MENKLSGLAFDRYRREAGLDRDHEEVKEVVNEQNIQELAFLRKVKMG